jgi:hypothetical protein
LQRTSWRSGLSKVSCCASRVDFVAYLLFRLAPSLTPFRLSLRPQTSPFPPPAKPSSSPLSPTQSTMATSRPSPRTSSSSIRSPSLTTGRPTSCSGSRRSSERETVWPRRLKTMRGVDLRAVVFVFLFFLPFPSRERPYTAFILMMTTLLICLAPGSRPIGKEAGGRGEKGRGATSALLFDALFPFPLSPPAQIPQRRAY